MKQRLVLASGSPRRRQLLALLGLPFEVCTADVEEHPQDGEFPRDLVRQLSEDKVRAVADKACSEWIVGADTIVVLDDEVLGKPSDADAALHMLRRLRNREHQVYTGISVLNLVTGDRFGAVVESTVWMRDYSDAEMMAYASSGEPLDKAGAYAIQDAIFDPVERVEGCYANVMGLPLCHLYRLLADAGVDVGAPPAAACDAFMGRRCLVAKGILTPGKRL